MSRQRCDRVLDEFDYFLRVRFLVRMVIHGDVRPFTRVDHGHRATDTGVSSGHQCGLPVEFAGAFVVFGEIARPWLEIRLETRLVEMLLGKWRLGFFLQVGWRHGRCQRNIQAFGIGRAGPERPSRACI
jgi:hypothetical protein